MSEPKATLGFRVHSGWAVSIAVAGTVESPSVVHRARIELSFKGGTFQPYHAAKQMAAEEAADFIDQCAVLAKSMAQFALRQVLGELAGHRVAASCVLGAGGRELPELTAILSSHALIHTAEGVFFRQAMIEANASLGLTVITVKERDLLTQSGVALRIPLDRIERCVSEMGKRMGAPWRQDEKLACIAAWLCLATSA